MPTIKFNYPYAKLKDHNGTVCRQARLLQVLDVEPENLTKEFTEEDTEGLYELDARCYLLLLIFRAPHGMFTTLRRDNFDNLDLYMNNTGKIFDIEIVESEYNDEQFTELF